MHHPLTMERTSAGAFALQAFLSSVCILFFLVGSATAEVVHITASVDPRQPQAQARQQALERAFADAVFKQALDLLPSPISDARSAALRAFLAPHSVEYVQSYQEVVGSKLPGEAQQQEASKVPSENSELSLDLNIQRASLRQTLVRLGFFAGAHHPGVFSLSFGAGVTEASVPPLVAGNVLLGLTRAQQAPVAVTLERLPQGYYKAVLRQGAIAIAADATDLSVLWLEIWAKFFVDRQNQSGSGQKRLGIAGFSSVDTMMEFSLMLATWDDSVQEPVLAALTLDETGVSAEFLCRVSNQANLDTRLRDTLPGRNLTLMSETGDVKP